MKKIILNKNNEYVGHSIVEDDKVDEMIDIYKDNYRGEEYTTAIEDVTAEYALKACIESRKAEYPTMEEFLNAYFDGGEVAVQELQNQRLAVKAKYPKP